MEVIHRIQTDTDGNVHVLFVRDLEKFHPYWTLGWNVEPMESIGSIGHEQIPMEMFMCYSCET